MTYIADSLELGYMSSGVKERKKYLQIDRNTVLRSVAGVYYGYSDYQLMCSCILWFCFKTILEGNNLKGNLLQRSGNWRTFGQSTCQI